MIQEIERAEIRAVQGYLLWSHLIPTGVRPYKFTLPDDRTGWPELVDVVFLAQDGKVMQRTPIGNVHNAGRVEITVSAPRRPSGLGWPK